MYPASPTNPKKTLVGLPVRNIDYGSLHKSLKIADRDVKRNLKPDFLDSLGRMCLNSSVNNKSESKVLQAPGNHDNTIGWQDNNKSRREVKVARAASPCLNVTLQDQSINNSRINGELCCLLN